MACTCDWTSPDGWNPDCLVHGDAVEFREEWEAYESAQYEQPTKEEREELDGLGSSNA